MARLLFIFMGRVKRFVEPPVPSKIIFVSRLPLVRLPFSRHVEKMKIICQVKEWSELISYREGHEISMSVFSVSQTLSL